MEILGITIAWETLGFIIAFTASEVIGNSALKENSVAQMVKTLIDNLRPMRKEDDKVVEVRKAVEILQRTLRDLGD